jgi:EmrB/QacA subfamily drug resistance transporter
MFNAGARRTDNPKILLWLVAIGFFMELLDSTIVNTALPSMANSLGESPLLMRSVIVSYALTLAVLIPASGYLADRFGTRRVFFAAILLFTIGSVCCAASRTLDQLVIARVLQGAGGSMLMPVGRLAVLRAFPGPKFIDALSFVTMPALIAPLIGPSLGGWLVQYTTWHWIFLINLPIGLIGCAATLVAMPEGERFRVGRFDLGGFVLISLSMVSTSFALDGLSGLGISHGVVLLLMVVGLVSLSGYVLSAARKTDPLFSLDLFRIRSFSIGILGNLFARIGSGSMPFLIPLYMQLCLAYSPLAAGVSMLPMPLAGILAKRLVSPLVLNFGYRNFLVTNTFLVGLGMASFALIGAGEPTWVRVVHMFLFGVVNSMQFTAMNTLTLKDLGRTKASAGNTLYSMVQMVAMSFGVAAAGALLATFTHGGLVDAPSDLVARAFRWTFLCVGAITCTSAWIFWHLDRDARVPVATPETTLTNA